MFHTSCVDDEEEDVEKNPELKLWRIVKYCKQQNGNITGYKILPDDLIKLGRVRFKIREVQSPGYRKMQLRHNAKNKKYMTMNTRQSSRLPKRKNENEVTETDNN